MNGSKPQNDEDSHGVIPKIDPLALNMLSDAEQKQIFELLGLDNPKTAKKTNELNARLKLTTPSNNSKTPSVLAPIKKTLDNPDKSSLNDLNYLLNEKNVDLSQIVSIRTF